MKIALIGYGKMGKAIEKIAVENGDEIVLKISSKNLKDNTLENLKKADVAIEFTNPDVAIQNIINCFDASLPVVSGSTGWYHKLNELKSNYGNKASLLYAPNFSIGVNLFFALNKKLAAMMNGFKEYDPKISESHHKEKLDSPSGTALHLAEDLIQNIDRKAKWKEVKNALNDNKPSNDLLIKAYRENGVIGEHEVSYTSEIDEITIKHKAFNREGFATGAYAAAKWIKNKTGFFTMKDMLKL